jgi:hypothetical protein
VTESFRCPHPLMVTTTIAETTMERPLDHLRDEFESMRVCGSRCPQVARLLAVGPEDAALILAQLEAEHGWPGNTRELRNAGRARRCCSSDGSELGRRFSRSPI